MDETAVATASGVAQVFDLHALKAFAPDKRVRKMLFKTDQLWSEIACYEPGQSTVMHSIRARRRRSSCWRATAHLRVEGEEIGCGRARSSSSPTPCSTTCATWGPTAA